MRILTLVFCIALFIVACQKENKNYSTRITLLNAVPNSNGFTIMVDESTLSSGLAYDAPVYNFPSIAATALVKWKDNGSTDFDSTFTTDLPNGTDYTVLFFDSLYKYKAYFIRDHWQQPASSQKGYIRFFPMIIGGDSLTVANDTNKVLIGNRKFGDFATGTGSFTAIDSFTTKLRLYNHRILIDSLPHATILPGKSYTLYAIGVIGSTGARKPKLILQEHK